MKESSGLFLRIVMGKPLKTILKVFLSENKTKQKVKQQCAEAGKGELVFKGQRFGLGR